MESHFLAMLSRMKYIERWSLMRNSDTENVCEHSLEVAMIAHMLAVISNIRLGNTLNIERAALIAMYHDCTEIITGDMPTPIKYFNTEIQSAFQQIEHDAANKLLNLLPEDMQSEYKTVFFTQEGEEHLWQLKKAADKLSALIKCIEESKVGNKEFINAEISIRKALANMKLKEVDIFLEEFLPSYYKTLDELN